MQLGKIETTGVGSDCHMGVPTEIGCVETDFVRNGVLDQPYLFGTAETENVRAHEAEMRLTL